MFGEYYLLGILFMGTGIWGNRSHYNTALMDIILLRLVSLCVIVISLYLTFYTCLVSVIYSISGIRKV